MNFLFNLLDAAADTSPDPNPAAEINWPFLVICIGAIIVMMVVSSRQRKKQQEANNAKLNSIKIGDQVKTIGLIYGEVVEIDADAMKVKVNVSMFGRETLSELDLLQVKPI